MKTLYLHLGFHKTATSSFQKTCAKNQAQLLKSNIVYPIFESKQLKQHCFFNHSAPLHNIFCGSAENYHINIKMGVSNLSLLKKEFASQLNHYLACEKDLILSGEDISTWQGNELLSLCELAKKHGFTIKPIALVRSPYAFHCSAKQQRIKGGYPDNLTTFNSQLSKINTLKSILPNTLFVPFNTACKHPSGPVGFLLEYMNIPLTHIALHNSNESISNVIARAQHELNFIQPRIINGKLNKKWINISHFGSGLSQNKFLLTEEELKELEGELEKENIEVKSLLGAHFLDENTKTASMPALNNLKVQTLIQKDTRLLKVQSLLTAALLLEESCIEEAYQITLILNQITPKNRFIKHRIWVNRTKLGVKVMRNWLTKRKL